MNLKITNYQFPDNQDGDWDGNWLNIYLKVDSKVGKWQTIDPSLTTWEVQEIIDWFDKLSTDKDPEIKLMTFAEPNLSFELLNEPTNNNKLIRIKFDLECRPKSATDEKEYFVDVSPMRGARPTAISTMRCWPRRANDALVVVTASIGAAVAWTTQFKQRSRALPRNPVPDHVKVYDAIAAGDVEGPGEAMRLLIDLALEDTRSAMKG